MHTQEFAPQRGAPAILAIAIHGVLIYGLAIGLSAVPSPTLPPKPFEFVSVPPDTPELPPENFDRSGPRVGDYVPPLAPPENPKIFYEPAPTPSTDGVKPGTGVTLPPSEPSFFNPRLLKSFEPPYPSVSRLRGEEGTVYVRIELSPDGRIIDVRLDRSCGASRLDDAALRAVRDWRFAPATRGGQGVGATVVVPVKFELRS